MTRRICLTVAYDGSCFAGWQRQKNALSVQQVIEEAIFRLFHEEVTLDASGRTDAGVHARGQIAAFTLEYPVPIEHLALAINSQLPPEIRILEAHQAADDFHPQYMAKRKTYRYTYYNGQFLLPQYRLYMAHVHEPMDEAKMDCALQTIVGEHDFYALSASGRTAKTTVRTIYAARVHRDLLENEIVHIDVCGNGFLYNMVRIIAGTLADVGRSRLPVDIFTQAIENRDRTILGMTAPAQGLTLMNVEYS